MVTNESSFNRSQRVSFLLYSVDVPRGVLLAEYRPPNFQKKEWRITEESSPGEYDYLGEGDSQSVWGRGSRHRKYCNILNFADFCDFLERCGLWVEKCHTMGSIGAPGFGLGCSPAVPFQSDDPNSIVCLYVTPIPPCMMSDWVSPGPLLPGMPEDLDMPNWDDASAAMWDWFDGGGWSARELAESLEEALTTEEVVVQ